MYIAAGELARAAARVAVSLIVSMPRDTRAAVLSPRASRRSTGLNRWVFRMTARDHFRIRYSPCFKALPSEPRPWSRPMRITSPASSSLSSAATWNKDFPVYISVTAVSERKSTSVKQTAGGEDKS